MPPFQSSITSPLLQRCSESVKHDMNLSKSSDLGIRSIRLGSIEFSVSPKTSRLRCFYRLSLLPESFPGRTHHGYRNKNSERRGPSAGAPEFWVISPSPSKGKVAAMVHDLSV